MHGCQPLYIEEQYDQDQAAKNTVEFFLMLCRSLFLPIYYYNKIHLPLMSLPFRIKTPAS